MLFTYAIKWEEKILVTSENREAFVWYKFIQEENKELEIKMKYKTIILSKCSMTDQANMTAKIAEINTLCLLESRTPTEEELVIIGQATDMITWIREQRDLCTEEILQLNNPGE